MQPKTNLYLVDSPFQALAAVELALRNYVDINVIVCALSGRPSRRHSDEQLKDVLNEIQWDCKLVFTYSSRLSFFSRLFGMKAFIKRLNRTYCNEVDRLYLGDFRQVWMQACRALLRAKETWLIDDGAATIDIVREYIDKNDFCPNFAKMGFKTHFTSLLYGITPSVRTRLKVSPTRVFSIFCHNKKTHIGNINHSLNYSGNDFSRLRQRYSRRKKSLDSNNLVYYFGSKYSESGIIDQNYELEFVGEIIKYYSQRGLKVIYYAHRGDSSEKLNAIERRYDIPIIQVSEMAEIYLLRQSQLPAEVAAGYSTVLHSVRVMFPTVVQRSFKLEDGRVSSDFRPIIERHYEYISSVGIQIVKF